MRPNRATLPACSVRSLLLTAVAATAAVVVFAVAALPGRAAAQSLVFSSRDQGFSFPGTAGGPEGRIVGGRLVDEQDADYGGGFYTRLLRIVNPTTLSFYCGGTLIQVIPTTKILTAAHCFTNPQAAVGDLVRIGGLTFNSGIERRISSVVVHPLYRNTGFDIEYDFAILSVANPPSAADFAAANIGPAFVNGFSRFPRPGRQLGVVGHGRTIGSNLDSSSNELKYARVPVNSWSQCDAWWTKTGVLGNRRPASSESIQVCGGLGIPDSTCQGDSGGGLFERRSVGGRVFFQVFGVVSYGFADVDDRRNTCGTLNPVYFAKVSVARSFIRANL
ncbi:hypothetical protein MMPV_004121 [Pyropia vietnamensis]